MTGRIEVFGLSGAGKSTTFVRLAPVLAKRFGGRDEIYLLPRKVPGARAILSSVRIVLAAFLRDLPGVALFAMRRANWRLLMKLGYRAAGVGLLPISRPGILLNSGTLQPFVQYDVERRAGNAQVPFAALLASLPMPDAAVYVHVSPDIAMQRWSAREGRDGHVRDEAATRQRFRDGAARCEQIQAFLRERNIPVHVCETGTVLPTSALEQLADFILEHLRGGREDSQ